MFYFYIIQSQKDKNWFYKGQTGDLRNRMRRHHSGMVKSTAKYLPVRLVYYEAYITRRAAKQREWSVKYHGSVSVPLLKRIKRSLEDKD